MPTAFITGATGFIGGHIARLLLEKGWRVRGLRRGDASGPFLEGAAVDWRSGDLRDFDRVREAMEGSDAVFHVAADYRLWARNPAEIIESNVGGTENVLEAALSCGAGRVVYTSSVGALGLRADGKPADENTPVRLEDMVGVYKRSKFLAERKAEEYFARGLPVVIVNPSTPVGAGDHKPTPTGRIIVDFLSGRMPAYIDTGLNLVDVRDVALGHLLALERGRAGEKYILGNGNGNRTLSEIFEALEKVSGIPAPRVRLPRAPILALAHLNAVFSKITGIEPRIPLEGVRMAHRRMFFDPGKAVRELGLPQTPVEEALKGAVEWFRENGYAPRSPRPVP
jgi:dihydroflavonol-4-reductase